MSSSSSPLSSDEMDVDTDATPPPCNGTSDTFCGTWTHPIELKPSAHYNRFEEFRNNANQALHGAFPVHRQPRNATASALLLEWQDDDLGVSSELSKLEEVLDQSFHFQTEMWKIPSREPARALSDKIYEWKDRYCEIEIPPGEPLPLLILYYGGHAEETAHNACKWRSSLNQASSSSLNWTTIQPILFDDTDADVLIILDCCYASCARFRAASTGRGTKEILAACANKLLTTGVEYRSFTSVLTEKLKAAAIENQLRGSSLSVVELHGYMHDDTKLQSQPIYARVNRNRYHTISLTPFPVSMQRQWGVASPLGTDALSVLSEDGRPCKESTRVLLSIHTSKSPTEDLIGFLKNECMLPLYVIGMKIEEVVSIEGIYESESTLTLVSVPLSIWALLPNHPACRYIGKIKSHNLCQEESVHRWFTQMKEQSAAAPSLFVDKEQRSSFSAQQTEESKESTWLATVAPVNAFSGDNSMFSQPDPGQSFASPVTGECSLIRQSPCYQAGPREPLPSLTTMSTFLASTESKGGAEKSISMTDMSEVRDDSTQSSRQPQGNKAYDHPDYPTLETPDAEEQVKSVDRNNSAYLGQNTDRIPTASTHGTDPSNHDFAAWNMFALRLDGDYGQVLPLSIKNVTSRGERQFRLPEMDRMNALKARSQAGCFRCWSMKEKCTPGQPPCVKCRRLMERKTFRIWMTPCSYKRLEERCQYLLPAPLASQISVAEMRSFLNQYRGGIPRNFLLSLYIGFGEPWKFWAVELVPGSHELYQTFGFHHRSAVENLGASPLRLTDPPVVPLWINPQLMQVNIDCWLDRMISNPAVGWQNHWFPDPSQIWQLKILEGICTQYHQNNGPRGRAGILAFDTLRWALKLSVLSYVMGHAFLVPEDDIGSLFQHLENPHFKGQAPQGYVCPRAANKFVKMMALPVLRLITERTLSGLNELLRANVPHTMIWDQTFGVVFLCLMVTSSIQMSLFQLAVTCAANNDSSFGRQDADREALAMDSELVVYIIGMFHDKFRTSKNKGLNPLGEGCSAGQASFSPFAAYVKAMTDKYYQLPTNDDLSNVGARRLLAEFMKHFLSGKEQLRI